MNSIEFIHAKLKRVNQILKESGPRGGEAKERLKEEETKLRTDKKATAKGAETIGTTTNKEKCEAETTED
jgi:hypothetical protein